MFFCLSPPGAIGPKIGPKAPKLVPTKTEIMLAFFLKIIHIIKLIYIYKMFVCLSVCPTIRAEGPKTGLKAQNLC